MSESESKLLIREVEEVETVDNYVSRSTFNLDRKIYLKNYCYCVYAEKTYKNCHTSLSKKKFKTLNAAKRYLERIQQNPKVSLSYMGIIEINAAETF